MILAVLSPLVLLLMLLRDLITLNPKPLNPKPLNPKTPKPSTLNLVVTKKVGGDSLHCLLVWLRARTLGFRVWKRGVYVQDSFPSWVF